MYNWTTDSWRNLFWHSVAVATGLMIPLCIGITYLYWVGGGGLR